MYLSYYNLKRKPFQINTDPRFLWLGEKHKEALATLKYGIRDSKGFLLLTGEIGTGKTTLINALLNSLDENVIVATISDPALSRLEFFQYVAISFGIRQPINGKVDFLMHFGRFLQEAAAQEQKVLLIIDEAQRLSHELLEEIRLLSNIEKQQAKLLNIFFIGQSEFNQVLEDPHNKALRQRISVNYHIDTLSEAETADYVRHRLLIAGSRKVLFSPDALHQIYLYSGGFPRLINIICDRALLTGYVEDVKQIKAKIIKECARELKLPQEKGREAGRRGGWGRKRKARKSDEKINNSGRFWLPALLGGPALVVGAGMLFIHAAGWHEGQKMQQLQEIVADLHGDFAEVPGTQAKAAKVNAATKPPVSEQPEMDSIPPQAAFGAKRSFPPAIADKRPSVEEQENGRTERAKSEELASVEKKKPAIIEENLPEGEEPLAAEKKEAAEGRDQRKEPAVGFNDPATGGAFIGGAGTAGPHNFIVNFALDSNELSRGSFQKLDRLARLLREHQELWAVVTGYTDTSGFYHYNKKISESRANMVKSYLVGRGIPAYKIQTFGRGPEDPIASNETAEGRELNRRVEIELIKGG